MKRGQWKQRNSYHVHQAHTHYFLKMQSYWIQYLHNNRSSPTVSHSFIQPAQACSRSTFLQTSLLVYFCRGSSSQILKVESFLSLSAATVACKPTFTKVLLFIPACSHWWNRSSTSAILTVIDANCILVFYFYMFTFCLSLPLFFFTLMLLSMIEFRLHKN